MWNALVFVTIDEWSYYIFSKSEKYLGTSKNLIKKYIFFRSEHNKAWHGEYAAIEVHQSRYFSKRSSNDARRHENSTPVGRKSDHAPDFFFTKLYSNNFMFQYYYVQRRTVAHHSRCYPISNSVQHSNKETK